MGGERPTLAGSQPDSDPLQATAGATHPLGTSSSPGATTPDPTRQPIYATPEDRLDIIRRTSGGAGTTAGTTPTSSPPKVGIKVKKVIESTGAKVGEVQVRSITDTSKVRLGPKERAVYVLRESNGEIAGVSMTPPELTTDDAVLKPGRTKSTKSAKRRFSTYRTAGKREGKALTVDVYPVEMQPGRNIEYYEEVVRSALKSEGHALPWDNTERRGSGFGTPGEGTRNVPITKGEMEELLREHRGNTSKVAQELGGFKKKINNRTVQLWARNLGLKPSDFRPGSKAVTVVPPTQHVGPPTTPPTTTPGSPTTPQAIPETSTAVPESPKTLPEPSKTLAETPKVLPEVPRSVGEKPGSGTSSTTTPTSASKPKTTTPTSASKPKTTTPTSASKPKTTTPTSASKVRGGATTSQGSSTSPIVGPGGFGGSYTGGATHPSGARASYGAHGRTDVMGNYDVGAGGGVGKGPVGAEVTFGKGHHVTPGEVVKVADGVWEVSYTIDDSTSMGAGLTGSVGPGGIGGDLSETTSELHTGAKRFTSKAEAEAFARNPNATVDFDGSATFPLTTAAGALMIPIKEKRGVGDIDTVTKGLSASASAATLSWSKHSSDGHSLSVFHKDDLTLQVTTVVTTEEGSDWSLATIGFANTKGGSNSNLFEVTYEFDFHSEAARTAYETFCALRLPPLNATLLSRRELSVQEEHDAFNMAGGARKFAGLTWQETVSDTSGQTKNYGGAQTDDESPGWLLSQLGDKEFHSNAQIVRSSHNDRDVGATAEVDVSGESGEHNFNEFAKIFGRGNASADAASASGKWRLTAEVPMEAIEDAEKDWPTLAKAKTKSEKMLIYSRLVKEHGAGMVGGQVGMSSLAWNLELKGDANFPGEAGRERLNELAKNLRAQLATTPAAADAAIHTLDDELATLARRREQVGEHKNYTDLPDDLRNEQLTIIDGHITALRSVRNSAIAASMRQSGTQMTEDGKERASVAALESKVAGLARQIQKELAIVSPAIAPNGDPRLRRSPLSREEMETAVSTVPGLWVEVEQAARRDGDLAKDVQQARENWRVAGDQLDRLQQVREIKRLLNKRVEAMNECLKAIRETAKAVGPVAPEKILWAHEDYWSKLGVFIPENPDSF
jgi:hypothetical protein